MDVIVAHWSHPAGGFREGGIDPQPPRRQNPHMHLLAACIARGQITGDSFWRDHAAALAALARTRFVDPESGALLGYFADDRSRLDGDLGRSVEPGHCFE